MIYQDPLAYLLGLEGIALLDAWPGSGRTADLTSTAVSGSISTISGRPFSSQDI